MIGRSGSGWRRSIFSRGSLLDRGCPGENALGRRAKLEGVGSFDCVSLAFRAGLTSVQDDIG